MHALDGVSARSGRERHSGSSASPVAARRRSLERCSASSSRPRRRHARGRTRSRRGWGNVARRIRALQIVFQTRFRAQPSPLGPADPPPRAEEARRITAQPHERGCSSDALGPPGRALRECPAGSALGRPQAAVAIARAFAGEPSSSSATSPRPPSTSPCRPRSSICSWSFKRKQGSLPLHLARSRRRPLHLRPDSGAVSRAV